jgi:hypothetical protein
MAAKKFLHFETRPAAGSAAGMTFPENESGAAADAIMLPETRTKALAIPDQARAIIVRDQATLDAAKLFLHDVDALQAEIDETFDPQISQAHKLHKSLLAEKKKFSEPLERAKTIVGRKAADFLAEQERDRREAERKRLEAEEKAREVAEKAVNTAEKLEADGKDKAAAAVVNQAHNRVDEILGAAPEVPEELDTSGLTVREDWKFSIVNEALIPREYLMPDEKKIGRIVRALKDQANIPGIRAYAEKGVATRAPRVNESEARI